MLRLKNLSNKYQKRLIRPEYAHTQATPYAATIHSSLRDATTGDIRAPLSGDTGGGATNPLTTRTDKAFVLKNSLIPGLVTVRVAGTEQVAIGSGANVAEQPFGLLANFIGGDLDEGFSGDTLQNEVGAWRGPDSTYSLLAPAFNDAALDTTGAGIASAQTLTAALAAATAGQAVLL